MKNIVADSEGKWEKNKVKYTMLGKNYYKRTPRWRKLKDNSNRKEIT